MPRKIRKSNSGSPDDIGELMEVDRDEMGSEKWGVKEMKFVNTSFSANTIKIGDIPKLLLMEVLVRLPVKLLFRSKLVSKEWRSIISEPYFVRMYTSRPSMSPHLQPWTFIFGTMHVDGSQYCDFSRHNLLGDIYSRDIIPPSLYFLRCPSAQHLDTEKYRVLGVSNGLVLYGPGVEEDRLDSIANYSICNPITGQWTSLPPHARDFKKLTMGFVTCVENGVLTSYRVVRLNLPVRRSSIMKIEVFSSECGEWTNFNVHLDLKIKFAIPARPTSLNGILHWGIYEHGIYEHGIIAYDPYHNPDFLRIIASPGDTSISSNNKTHYGVRSLRDVHQGRLRYFELDDQFVRPHGYSSFSVWVLNDYSTGDWSLQHRITFTDELYDGILSGQRLFLRPLSFHPFDSDIVYFECQSTIFSYNFESRELESHGDPFDIEYYRTKRAWLSICLLVIPPWPVYIPE